MAVDHATLLRINRLFTFDDLVVHYGGPRSLWEKWGDSLPLFSIQDGIAVYLESAVDDFLTDVGQRLQTGLAEKPMPDVTAGVSSQYTPSDELTTRAAASYLSVSVDTLEKYVSNGLLARRNISPPGSGKPRYRFRVADLDRLKNQSYRKVIPKEEPAGRLRRRAKAQVYEHLDL